MIGKNFHVLFEIAEKIHVIVVNRIFKLCNVGIKSNNSRIYSKIPTICTCLTAIETRTDRQYHIGLRENEICLTISVCTHKSEAIRRISGNVNRYHRGENRYLQSLDKSAKFADFTALLYTCADNYTWTLRTIYHINYLLRFNF